MVCNSAFNLLRPLSSLAFVLPVNEKASDTKWSYAKSGMCCAVEENHEQTILALTRSLRSVTLRYLAQFLSLCALQDYSL